MLRAACMSSHFQTVPCRAPSKPVQIVKGAGCVKMQELAKQSRQCLMMMLLPNAALSLSHIGVKSLSERHMSGGGLTPLRLKISHARNPALLQAKLGLSLVG